ncbi:unnamed protein product [Ambrosiozyma monospora]|uniref:Unnamed protein product n=1 Tax=Ambrosiozyma monospora TaxID=43982 RepID=A0A9W6YUR1_AMBMO|nr:unnamed protein product [Ambrosiozyma monospora]
MSPSASTTASVKAYALLAFDTLYSKLHKVPKIPLSKITTLVDSNNNPKPERCPLFVTWNIQDKSEDEKELRGCIGNFGDLKLPAGVEEYALIAALEDTRFNPIRSKELHQLSCSVTLLKHFEKGRDPLDWELGKHGIRIVINGGRSATFLPDVAVEQGWDKDATLKNLVRKAGFYGGDWKTMNIELTRYQGIKDSIDFDEYIKARKELVGSE